MSSKEEQSHSNEAVHTSQEGDESWSNAQGKLSFELLAAVNESKELLHKLSGIHVIRRQVLFSDPDFEKSFVVSLEPKQRSRFFLFGVIAFLFGLYYLIYFNLPNPVYDAADATKAPKARAAVLLFRIACGIQIGLSILITVLALHKKLLMGTLERVIQYSVIFGTSILILIMDPWRACAIVFGKNNGAAAAIPYLFKNVETLTTNTGVVMLLVGCVMYLAFVMNMRFRRLFWLCISTSMLFVFVSFYFKVPTCTTRYPSYMIFCDEPADLGNINFLTPLQLLGLYIISLFGKFELEMLQRATFLELELAQRRIEVLHKTIHAMGDQSDSLSQSHATRERLKSAEKIVEKLRLMTNSEVSDELVNVLNTLKETSKTMTIMDFQKEVLIGPIRTGIEFKEAEVTRWIEHVHSGAGLERRTSVKSGGESSNSGPFLYRILDTDLGVSAKSLMKRIGADWTLNPAELQKTLRANNATKLDAFSLTARALIGPFLSNLLRGTDVQSVNSIITSLNQAYMDVPFHNAERAALVGHHASFLLNLTGVGKFVTGVDRLALNLAALCINISHFGRSNSFLIDSRHELAVRYNDASVLENFHASKAIEVIYGSGGNFLAKLSMKDEKKFRNRLIQLILSTDAALFFSQLNELQMRLLGPDMFSEDDLLETDRRIGLVSVLRSADLGFYAMPFDIHSLWATRLTSEMALQGDEEKRLGLPISPMCNREEQIVPNMMIGMIDMLAIPFFHEVMAFAETTNGGNEKLRESAMSIAKYLRDNRDHWSQSQSSSKSDSIYVPLPIQQKAPAALIASRPSQESQKTEEEQPLLEDKDDEDEGEPPLVSYTEMHTL